MLGWPGMGHLIQKECVDMTIFDDILATAKSAADVVGKKAVLVKELSRLRLTMAELNKEISRNFEALGRLVYDASKSGNSYDVNDSVLAIDELYEELSALSEELNRLRGRTVCPCCGHENVLGATFCNKCGTRLPEQEEEEKAEAEPGDTEEPDTAAPVADDAGDEDEEAAAPAAEAPRPVEPEDDGTGKE